VKSIDLKKEERLRSTIDAYNKFASYFPKESKYSREVEGYFTNTKKQIANLSKQ
jgi:hypothetical protein